MDTRRSRNRVYVKRFKNHSKQELVQMVVIFAFILVSSLISVLLPVYFAHLPLSGG